MNCCKTVCRLLNADVPRATARAARLWIESGQTCHLGRHVYLTLERVRDHLSGRIEHRMHVHGPAILLRGVPVCSVLDLRKSTGLRVIPRAMQNDRLFAEFAQA